MLHLSGAAEALGERRENAMLSRSEFASCAHCGVLLPFVAGHVLSWRVDERYACNEFCAEGVERQAPGRDTAANHAAANSVPIPKFARSRGTL
jgi:hypothetical protein